MYTAVVVSAANNTGTKLVPVLPEHGEAFVYGACIDEIAGLCVTRNVNACECVELDSIHFVRVVLAKWVKVPNYEP